jgi:hypothetical protein
MPPIHFNGLLAIVTQDLRDLHPDFGDFIRLVPTFDLERQFGGVGGDFILAETDIASIRFRLFEIEIRLVEAHEHGEIRNGACHVRPGRRRVKLELGGVLPSRIVAGMRSNHSQQSEQRQQKLYIHERHHPFVSSTRALPSAFATLRKGESKAMDADAINLTKLFFGM